MVAALKYPSVLRKKSVYFVKSYEVDDELTASQMEAGAVTMGELGPQPLGQMSLMMDELYTPLLKNKKNQVRGGGGGGGGGGGVM